MARLPLSISFEEEFVERIDKAKGKNEPRSRFIEDIISDYLNNSKGKNSPLARDPQASPKGVKR